ncbi:peptidoglycan-binding protein [Patescibacteria group bacterium]|nr:peptidoglycan-binding protein [Patescibacteria group bacterium]
MKKKAIFISFIGIIFLLSGIGGDIANAREIPWARGMRSAEVKALQSILKADTEIYPEGYVTGYFGPLTEKAIKRLQKRCGISETGVVDPETERCIFPIEYKIRVISPNGGEVWDRNEIQTVKWEVIAPSGEEEVIPEIKPYLFWPKASIDLFRRVIITPECEPGEVCPAAVKSVFVKHVATVNLFNRAYSWRITKDIPDGKDYVIRISVGRGIIPFTLEEKVIIEPEEIWPVPPRPVPPERLYWDESDGPFEITGDIIHPCPEPICPLCPGLPVEEVIRALERITNELQRVIALLKEMSR